MYDQKGALQSLAEACSIAWHSHRPCLPRLAPNPVAPHDTPSPPPLPLIGTAAEAAASLGVPAAAIAKSVAVLAAGKPWLAVVRGSRRLDWHKAGWAGRCTCRGPAAVSSKHLAT